MSSSAHATAGQQHRPQVLEEAPRRSTLRKRRRRNSDRRAVALMLLPWVVGMAVFVIGPLIATLILSFTRYTILRPPEGVGLANYERMLGNDAFWSSWAVTIKYAAGGTIVTLVLALIVALGIFHIRRGKGFWRTAIYFPVLLAGTAEALVMGTVWSANYGLVNRFLALFGVAGPPWLQSADWALPAFMLMRYWSIGTVMLLLLGARYAVPAELYEAAQIDGGRGWRLFRHVTFPMMSPVFLFVTILGVISSLQAFTQIFIMTRGGPQRSTEVVGIHIYFEAFENLRMGYASAISWSLFVVTMAFVLVLFATSKWWVYYEFGEDDW